MNDGGLIAVVVCGRGQGGAARASTERRGGLRRSMGKLLGQMSIGGLGRSMADDELMGAVVLGH